MGRLSWPGRERGPDSAIGPGDLGLGCLFGFWFARNVRDQIAGSGIGPHGTRRIVEQPGGTISVAGREDA